jgi:hypothetical protein
MDIIGYGDLGLRDNINIRHFTAFPLLSAVRASMRQPTEEDKEIYFKMKSLGAER